jgi:hypothetical protein
MNYDILKNEKMNCLGIFERFKQKQIEEKS